MKLSLLLLLAVFVLVHTPQGKQTGDGSGEAAVMTSSLERRRRDALLINWRKETTFVQHLTCKITKLEER